MTGASGEKGLPAGKEAEIRASFARQGMMRAAGATIAALEPGRCVIELPFSDAVSQQGGFFHGGMIGALGDSAGGYAAMSLLPVGAEVLTLDYKVDFLRPAAGARLFAEGSVLRAGRLVSVTRVDVHVETADGRHVLCAALQQSIIRAPDPAS